MKTEDIGKFKESLRQFTGSDTFTKYQPGVIITEGALFLAKEAGAYWLLDLVWSYQHSPNVKDEDFQVYKFKVTDTCGKIIIENGNDRILAEQDIEFTDFPLEEITLWAVRNELNGVTVMLPSEY